MQRGVRLSSRKGQTVTEGPEQQGHRREAAPQPLCPITPGKEGPESQWAPQAEVMLPPTRMGKQAVGSSQVTDSGTEAAGEGMA